MSAYIGNILVDSKLGNLNTNLIRTDLDLIRDGLVFDFSADEYVSGSLQWNSNVGNYAAFVTGTTSGPLEKLSDGVGFDGTKWLQFDNATTSSINTSTWQIYVFTDFSNTGLGQTSEVAHQFFSKGGGAAPSWNFGYYNGTGTSAGAGLGVIGDGAANLSIFEGYNTDSLYSPLSQKDKQLFCYTYQSGSGTAPNSYPSVTINWYDTAIGGTVLSSYAALRNTSFTGSAASPLLFGYGITQNMDNVSGSIVRLFAYNRILTQEERKRNWFILTGELIP